MCGALNPHELQGDDSELWWEASFDIPKGAVAVNFVVNCENGWDNNGGKDHKVRKDGSMSHECCQAAAGMVLTASTQTHRLHFLPRSARRVWFHNCWMALWHAQHRTIAARQATGRPLHRSCL